MIIRPTLGQLLRSVHDSLQTTVAPTVADGSARIALDMALAVLRTTAARADDEISAVAGESGDILDLARRIQARIGSDPALDAAVAHYDSRATQRASSDGLYSAYDAASDVLAGCIEATFRRGDAVGRAELHCLLEQRRDREMSMIGRFDSVGRT